MCDQLLVFFQFYALMWAFIARLSLTDLVCPYSNIALFNYDN